MRASARAWYVAKLEESCSNVNIGMNRVVESRFWMRRACGFFRPDTEESWNAGNREAVFGKLMMVMLTLLASTWEGLRSQVLGGWRDVVKYRE